MNYQEHSHKKPQKFSNAFYIIIGCCIVVLGGAAWFALSNLSKPETKKEYPDNHSSYYIESLPEISPPEDPAEPTAESETEIPFEAPPVQNEAPKVPAFTMPVEGEIIKPFSDKTLIFSKTYGDMRLHNGVDIGCKVGTQVGAATDGTVLSVEKDGNLGNIVVINHFGITVKYASLEEIKVKAGDGVKMGDIIGVVGTVPSECEDAPHLHLEALKDNKPFSPLAAIGLE